MADLKLAKLPERTPVKLTINVAPELHHSLADYASLYAQTYGQAEQIADLIPYMLQSFLDSDRTFTKARQVLGRSTT